MSERWLRLHAEFFADPKIARIHPYSRLVFQRLWFLCLESPETLSWKPAMPDTVAEDLARLTDLPDEAVDYIKADLPKMESMGMIAIDRETGAVTPCNVLKRQPRYIRTGKPSDRPEAVLERVRKHRETKVKRDVTPCNASNDRVEENRSYLPPNPPPAGGGNSSEPVRAPDPPPPDAPCPGCAKLLADPAVWKSNRRRKRVCPQGHHLARDVNEAIAIRAKQLGKPPNDFLDSLAGAGPELLGREIAAGRIVVATEGGGP